MKMCPDCGEPIPYTGRGRPRTRCADCATVHAHDTKRAVRLDVNERVKLHNYRKPHALARLNALRNRLEKIESEFKWFQERYGVTGTGFIEAIGDIDIAIDTVNNTDHLMPVVVKNEDWRKK